jgi:hypothetical protein
LELSSKKLDKFQRNIKYSPILNKEDLSGEYFQNQTGELVVVAEHGEGGLPSAVMNI